MEGLESFFTASQQLRLFLLSCLFGIPIGIVYDIFRTIRVVIPHGKILAALEDILFFALYGVFIMCFTVTAARSEFRFYFCAGNLLGFIVYFFTVGNLVVSVIKKIAVFIKKGIYFVFRPVGVIILKGAAAFFVGIFKKKKNIKKNSQTS